MNEFGVGADGLPDAIGQFTLRVTQRTGIVPEPGTIPLVVTAELVLLDLGAKRATLAQPQAA